MRLLPYTSAVLGKIKLSKLVEALSWHNDDELNIYTMSVCLIIKAAFPFFICTFSIHTKFWPLLFGVHSCGSYWEQQDTWTVTSSPYGEKNLAFCTAQLTVRSNMLTTNTRLMNIEENQIPKGQNPYNPFQKFYCKCAQSFCSLPFPLLYSAFTMLCFTNLILLCSFMFLKCTLLLFFQGKLFVDWTKKKPAFS